MTGLVLLKPHFVDYFCYSIKYALKYVGFAFRDLGQCRRCGRLGMLQLDPDLSLCGLLFLVESLYYPPVLGVFPSE